MGRASRLVTLAVVLLASACGYGDDAVDSGQARVTWTIARGGVPIDCATAGAATVAIDFVAIAGCDPDDGCDPPEERAACGAGAATSEWMAYATYRGELWLRAADDSPLATATIETDLERAPVAVTFTLE